MFRASRIVALVALFGGFTGITVANPAPAPVLGPGAFTWDTYVGKDGKTYSYPRWTLLPNQTTVELDKAQGILDAGKDFTATSAKMVLSTPGALPGSWTVRYTDDKVQIGPKDANNKHLLIGTDKTIPKITYGSGIDVRITWQITVKNQNNAEFKLDFGPYDSKAEAK